MHNLNFNENTGEYSFYSVKQSAWHGHGHISETYERSEQVIEKSGLKYPVYKLPNIHRLADGREVEADNSFFTYRGDTGQILGDKLSADYQVIQNHEAFEFFDEIAGKDGIFYETAGALGNGERIFITAKLPSYIKVGNDDVIEKYLFLTTSHDGKGSVTAAFTPVRIVCNNTLNAALKNCNHTINIRHLQGAQKQLRQAHLVMDMVNTTAPLIEQKFNAWSKVRIEDQQVKQLIALAMTTDKESIEHIKGARWSELSSKLHNNINSAFAYAMMADSQKLETTKGTLFGAYNGMTGFYQNVKNFASDEEKTKSILLGGTAQKHGQSAFDLCLQFEKHGADILKLN